MLLLQIVTLQLAMVHKVINQGDSVILTDTMHLIQALVRVERQFFAHLLNFLCLLWEHVSESLLLVFHKIKDFCLELVHAPLSVAPFFGVLLEQFVLSLFQTGELFLVV